MNVVLICWEPGNPVFPEVLTEEQKKNYLCVLDLRQFWKGVVRSWSQVHEGVNVLVPGSPVETGVTDYKNISILVGGTLEISRLTSE